MCVASRSAASAKPVAREAPDVLQPEEETGHEEGNCFALGGIGDDLVCACAFRRHRQERLSRWLEAVSLPLRIGWQALEVALSLAIRWRCCGVLANPSFGFRLIRDARCGTAKVADQVTCGRPPSKRRSAAVCDYWMCLGGDTILHGARRTALGDGAPHSKWLSSLPCMWRHQTQWKSSAD